MTVTCRDPSLHFAGLTHQAALLASGQVTSTALTELSLAQASTVGATLGAFRCLRADEALAEAASADDRLAAGERLPLLGVPVAIKDDIDICGEDTRFGCPGHFSPKRHDCEAVRRLKLAGAVIVGKTNTPELGQWPFTEGPAFGIAHNPWSLSHTPGGSSGGAAAAVAAGVVPAALGSDGAGSVRIPAAWTGLVGIKPQRGRISTWPEPESFNGLTCIGPLARTVADTALLLDAVAGSHPGDLHTPPPPTEPFLAAAEREPRRLVIALSLKIPFSIAPTELHPDVRATVERLAGVLSRLGHEVIHDDPSYGIVGLSFFPRSTCALAGWVDQVPDPTLLDPRTLHNAHIGRLCRGPALAFARSLEGPLRRSVGRIFRRADVVLAPTTATPPPPIGTIDGLGNWDTDKAMVAACPCTWPWNVLGWPAINVPAGLTSDGLPLGAQLMGPANSEPLLISLAAQLEASERWHCRTPPPVS